MRFHSPCLRGNQAQSSTMLGNSYRLGGEQVERRSPIDRASALMRSASFCLPGALGEVTSKHGERPARSAPNAAGALNERGLTLRPTPQGRLLLAPSDDAPELETARAERIERLLLARRVTGSSGSGRRDAEARVPL